MIAAPEFIHWKLTRDEDGVAWATLDRAGESTNALSGAVMAELVQMLDHLDAEPPRGLIFRSGKTAGFIAGADIHEFDDLVTPENGLRLVARGWDLFNRVAALSYPTLALIRGHCMGGGLELSLACRYRIVVGQPDTRLGLPEVKLGIVPAWGGMRRLPQRIGAVAALDMMLTGKTVDARKAWRIGLADACVPPRLMERAARLRVLDPTPPRALGLWQRLLNGPLRALVVRQARHQVARKVSPEHYPAPYALLDLWQHQDGNALAAPEVLHRILASPTARNLLRVFHLQERLKRFGKGSAFKPQRVHVVGAGVMGGDIAAWCVAQGLTVTLQDQSLERIAPALTRAEALFARLLKTPLACRAARDRLIPDPAGAGVAHADVVIEAVFENLAVKQQILAALEPRLKPAALLASNTSSLRLEDIAVGLRRPERLVGIHFFNPVALMPLVEVVEVQGAAPEALQAAAAFVGALGKLPLPVRSAPGFLVNAVLAPYMHEALRCLDEGIAPATLDAALEAFGMPMGPVELMDTVGLDIVMAAGQQLSAGAPAACLIQCLDQGHLGKKAGHGFYVWVKGKPLKPAFGAAPPGLAERLIAPLTARAAALVAEGVVPDADLADAGVIFGTGFAPFSGGPLHRTTTPGA
ncbi:MAG: enoyl-CoA hydratase/isomerase family protein [Betaproteobacteria bacterium]|nr:enoyl-CoA hydratase/isomerase family protein [Betaproteobacteria bacterium]